MKLELECSEIDCSEDYINQSVLEFQELDNNGVQIMIDVYAGHRVKIKLSKKELIKALEILK